MGKRQTKRNIKAQIMQGFSLVIAVPIVMSAITMLYAFSIGDRVGYFSDVAYNQNATKEAIIGHYAWITQLGDSISEGVEFKGGRNPETCALGSWLSSMPEEDKSDPVIAAAITGLMEPHNYMHNTVEELLVLSKSDNKTAYNRYYSEIKPRVTVVIDEITKITTRYDEIAERVSAQVKSMIVYMIVLTGALAIAGVVASVVVGNRLARKISTPIVEVAKWADRMSHGDIAYNPDLQCTADRNTDDEICQMVQSFSEMAQGIGNNAGVVKRVADGDLTAYVDIRSDVDIMGKSLYRMVQSNDLMLADIYSIAENVAASANDISAASTRLSQNTSEQAATVEEISTSAALVSELSRRNAGSVSEVMNSFNQIRTDVDDSSRQMGSLMTAVEDIRVASDRISAIIKTIDDIAFQTNILALNAAVEAARAGAAGKGFAVVADEVRSLASKSAEAASSTKELIDNTIATTRKGAKLATETNATFAKITGKIADTATTVETIAGASNEQVQALDEVRNNIEAVAEAQADTAALSQESSATSEQMKSYAMLLHDEINRFTLRKREPGKPYIPEEKRDDPEFIRQATANYNEAVAQGRVKQK